MIMGAQGICFAVAANTALHVLTQILAHGRVRRARIGIVGEQVPLVARAAYRAGLKQKSGVAVREIQGASPADKAGLKAGDVVVRIDGEVITGIDDIFRVLDDKRIGRTVPMAILRAHELVEIELSPEERER
jgi:S1-C subfamily serine protease